MLKPTIAKDLTSELKDERSKLHDLAWELDDLEKHLAEIDTTTPLSTLSQMRQKREWLEEAVLQQMLYVERLEQRLEALKFPNINAA